MLAKIKSALGIGGPDIDPTEVETRVPDVGDEVVAVHNGRKFEATVVQVDLGGDMVVVEESEVPMSALVEVDTPDDKELPDHFAFSGGSDD